MFSQELLRAVLPSGRASSFLQLNKHLARGYLVAYYFKHLQSVILTWDGETLPLPMKAVLLDSPGSLKC